jgi:hypothetical protein
MGTSSSFTPTDIPHGYRIYEDRLTPAGISFHRADAEAFARSADRWIELERERGNPRDQNAIGVAIPMVVSR